MPDGAATKPDCATFLSTGTIYLNGDRIISPEIVRILRYLLPIMAAMKKNNVTDIIDVKISIHDGGSNRSKRFQVGATLAGNLENQ